MWVCPAGSGPPVCVATFTRLSGDDRTVDTAAAGREAFYDRMGLKRFQDDRLACTIVRMMHRYIVLLLAVGLLPTQSQRIHSFKNWATLRDANWSSLLFEPSAFVVKSHVRLRNRPEGYQPSTDCSKYVGMGYLDLIRSSKQMLCSQGRSASIRKLHASSDVRSQKEPSLSSSQSSVDCYTAPHVQMGSKASISLCRSRNMVLDTCAFLSGRRKGTLTKKFPLPAQGSVKLACDMANYTSLMESSSDLQWLNSLHHEVWWLNATRDDSAVAKFCASGSKSLVTTPTLFVMRDRHANYAHEMETVSMAFSFLAALEPADVAQRGIQVVIVDQAPPTGFLETWARISRPYRLRILAHDPFPANTCFRSAYHVYTFAAGIGYNTNGETVSCESPVAMGLSHWLRQLYEERDPAMPVDPDLLTPALAAAATAGPVAAAAGVRGMRAPTSGIVMKNVVWLSRRNLELVRLLLNASVGWKAMRMVRNEDQVVAGMLAAVQEWNSESCLVRAFERDIQKAYEESLYTVNPIHIGPGGNSGESGKVGAARRRASTTSPKPRKGRHRRKLHGAVADGGLEMEPPDLNSSDLGEDLGQEGDDYNLGSEHQDGAGQDQQHMAGEHDMEVARAGSSSVGEGGRTARSVLASKGTGGSDIDEHGNDGDDEEEDVRLTTRTDRGDDEDEETGDSGWGLDRDPLRSKFGSKGQSSAKAISMESLWEDTTGLGNCRRTNVLFTFVDGDFNDIPYHQQLKLIFRTGVLVGVHGAGLTHGFFMPPGQSAVLQLLGDSFAQVPANNVFRNMAVGLGNFYQDVMYEGVDVKISVLKQAVKRAMDFVATQVMDAQIKQFGGTLPPLVLDDQNHFSIVVPSPLQCPRNRTVPW
ncbi:hypothetical protein VOLCADRAFT_106623 [Volvox carteri f. nagariensis]|uniref:Uncharacterized protein n=1 Tax=Volvox carteri f. nagariensis TaxID=3068 RepID=D8U8P5_VOLCA|nr:uncharacterized protein VOLCADRAFT_106623 [Volvox carteri f. nagariensis]EFJ43783.1 hypothetical protein VOLCADRAFT_106623 [Volvox carteri f. nagariensis]|eukprot:XP_002955029.1 hypothetical protein VOLCADRAFT_106623 [Volvox carteri f. nagariensis]